MAAKLKVVVFEPDAGCAAHLRSLLAGRVFADVRFAATAEGAAGLLHSERPDLVLASAFAPPRAEEQLVAALKQIDPDGRVPILTIPPVTAPPDERREKPGLLARLGRRRADPGLPFDPVALRARIGETLTELRQMQHVPRAPARLEPSPQEAGPSLPARPLLEVSRPAPASAIVSAARVESVVRQRHRVDRARRIPPDELAARCTLTTPAGFIVRMVNLSASGVLFESPRKFTPDSDTSLNLFGPQTNLDLPARIIRSEAAAVSGLGVTYQTAAAFLDRTELLAALFPGTPASARPQSLADLLIEVTTALSRTGHGDDARAAFEAGLRHLIPGCRVRLATAIVPMDGDEAIYFTVPAATRTILQATFDRGHEPSSEQFKLLKAAASLASLILHCDATTAIARSA